MTDFKQDLAISKVLSLMNSYIFDTNQRKAEELVQEWLNIYHVNWIYLATIEALYLGRYKAVSIEQIMYGWLRRGQPTTHFGGDFERVICRKLPRHLSTVNSLEVDSENGQPTSDREENNHNNNVTDSSESLIDTQVTPFPSSKKESSSNLVKNNTQGIKIFQPLPDASGFFQKLKAFADNQPKKKEQKTNQQSSKE